MAMGGNHADGNISFACIADGFQQDPAFVLCISTSLGQKDSALWLGQNKFHYTFRNQPVGLARPMPFRGVCVCEIYNITILKIPFVFSNRVFA